MMPVEAPRRANGPGRRRRHVRRPAGCCVDPAAVRLLLLRAPEVVRLRRRAVAGAVRRRRRSSGSSGSPRRRWIPASLDLKIALDNSRLNQTYNTPALATLHLLASQVAWMNDNGGLAFSAGRSRPIGRDRSTAGPSASDFASPFVANPASAARRRHRSTSTTRSTPPPSRRAARQRDRRHRALPQARPQPAAHRDVPGHRPRGRRLPVWVHQLRRRAPLGHPRTGRSDGPCSISVSTSASGTGRPLHASTPTLIARPRWRHRSWTCAAEEPPAVVGRPVGGEEVRGPGVIGKREVAERDGVTPDVEVVRLGQAEADRLVGLGVTLRVARPDPAAVVVAGHQDLLAAQSPGRREGVRDSPHGHVAHDVHRVVVTDGVVPSATSPASMSATLAKGRRQYRMMLAWPKWRSAVKNLTPPCWPVRLAPPGTRRPSRCRRPRRR